jgi:ABC-2 type transport system ATP-binding protein
MRAGPGIELNGASKRFGARRAARSVDALRTISLQVPSGAVWGVVGPNGAGKSTLFGLILGFLFPTDGDVEVDGLEPRSYARRHGAGYLPERFALPGEWTVERALHALARMDALGKSSMERVSVTLERFGLLEHAHKRMATLSRGLVQRVGLAQALLGDHALVVFDEPTEGLDPLWRIRLRELFDELRARGATVLVASHDLSEIERLTDHVIVLDGGRIQEQIEVRATIPTLAYTLRITTPHPLVLELFHGAHVGEGEGTYAVTVTDANELSRRLAALLEAGVVIEAVQPGSPSLETRVRRSLEGVDRTS